MTDDELHIVADMQQYCDDNEVTSYMEFKLYVKKNRPDWYSVLRKRNVARFIGTYIASLRRELKSKRRMSKPRNEATL